MYGRHMWASSTLFYRKKPSTKKTEENYYYYYYKKWLKLQLKCNYTIYPVWSITEDRGQIVD